MTIGTPVSSADAEAVPAYASTTEDVLARLGSDSGRGLTEAEAGRRVATYGRNEIAAEKPPSTVAVALGQLRDPMNLMLIAVTLAHAALAARGRAGVLLLDEVAAHLDPVRREALFERLSDSGTQVWFTGTEAAPFDAILGEAVVWRVASGEARREN